MKFLAYYEKNPEEREKVRGNKMKSRICLDVVFEKMVFDVFFDYLLTD